MRTRTLARQIGGGHIQQAGLAETLGAVSALQRELAPETLGELSSALEQLQMATAVLHQEHEQLVMLRAVEEELRMYVRQQAAIAEMGQRALIDRDLSTLMDEAAAIIAQILEVEFCSVLELLPDRRALLLRASVGWPAGCVGHATVGIGTDSQAGYALACQEPLIVADMGTEMRFNASPLLHRHGVISGLSVIIPGQDRPSGVISAHTTRQRMFTEDEIHFMQAVANVLAAAIERRRAEDGVHALNAELEQCVHERTMQLTAANTLKNELLSREQAMRATAELAEQRFRNLVESLDAIVWEANAETWQFTFVNQRAESLLGYPVERWLAEPGFLINQIHPEDRAQVIAQYQAATREDRDQAFEYRVLAADGRVIWLRDMLHAIPDALGRVRQLRGLMIDITAHKRLETQFLQAQKMESIGRLASGVAHDFNNLLTAISGYTELMLEELPPEAAMRDDLEEISKIADRAVNLTHQLLAFAREQTFQPQIVNLNDVIQDVDKLLHRLIGEDIQLVTLPASDLHLVKADRGQIEQVLLNLAVNARDAMPHGGKLIIETSNVVLDRAYTRQHVAIAPGDYVMLTVSDTGVGMSEIVQEHLFEPFFTTKEPDRGTGLGLATCYGIIKQHGGHLWVYSEVGQGATFKIYLPRVATGAEQRAIHPDADAMPRGIETILLVEDEPMVRAPTARTLREHGYTVLEAANGEEALRIAQEQPGLAIQLLLTDVVMPHIGGRDVAARLKALHPTLKVVFASGYTDDVVVHHGILDPGDAFLQKPYAPAALVRKVREVLDS